MTANTKADQFILRSTQSDLRLEITNLRGEYLTARLESRYLSAGVDVCTYTDSHGLLNMLERLTRYERPWKDEEVWEGIERDLVIGARCSSLGAVTFRIELRQFRGEEDWRLTTELVTEMGMLPNIASAARAFFGPSPY